MLDLQYVLTLAQIHTQAIAKPSATDKATWWGCGNHIPSVMDSIPESEWCTCEPKVEKDGKQYPPKSEQNP